MFGYIIFYLYLCTRISEMERTPIGQFNKKIKYIDIEKKK